MSKAGFIVLLGVIAIFLPFLGIPTVAKTVVAVGSGVLVAVLGLLVREERRWLLRALKGDHRTDTYSENGPTDVLAVETHGTKETTKVS